MNSDEIKGRMKQRASFALEELTEADLRQSGCQVRVFVVPEQFNERVRYLGDLLVQMLTRENAGDEKLRPVVGQIAQTLSYLLNSSSWADGTLHEFDRDEVRRKLQRISR